MNKYDALDNTMEWIKNSSSEDFMRGFNTLEGEYCGITIGEYIESLSDFEEHEEITYSIITTEDFIFGLENEFVSLSEPLDIISYETGSGVMERISVNAELNSSSDIIDSYDASNDDLYLDMSYAA